MNKSKYTKEDFKYDLEKGAVFNFKAKGYLKLLFLLWVIVLVGIGGYYLVIITLIIPSTGLLVGSVLIATAVIGFIFGMFTITRKIEIDPKGITWKKGFSEMRIKFKEIEDISFFPSVFLNLHTAKFFLYNKKKYKIRTSLMTTPKKWYSEEMIRSIIDSYWRKVNPDARHSTKSVSSTTQTQKKTISLINPKANLPKESSSSIQGYKCSSCLTIHERSHKFCPNCGADME